MPCPCSPFLTGAKKNEVLGARRDQFDLAAGTWSKPASTTKQAKLHHVPLSGPAIELLAALKSRHERGPFVFPGRNGQPITDIKRSWSTICKRAGLQDFRKHDLRHSFASLLINEALGLPAIGQLLGHSRRETTDSHLALETTRAATEKVGRLIKM